MVIRIIYDKKVIFLLLFLCFINKYVILYKIIILRNNIYVKREKYRLERSWKK